MCRLAGTFVTQQYDKYHNLMIFKDSVCQEETEPDYNRDANHSDFCGIIPIIKANFRITILDVKITANCDFNTVPD